MTVGAEEPTPLKRRLLRRIEIDGPMPVSDYMEACLSDPDHGYYATREPFGATGDFVTAPEISQMFGELIGLWAIERWRETGAPATFVLAELGPGRGTLMADLLRAARIEPAFLAGARIVLVETSKRLRLMQRQTLASHLLEWRSDIHSLPGGPLIVVANEFFDALPIRQFVRTESGIAERVVGATGDDLVFGLRPGASLGPELDRPLRAQPPGAVFEISPASRGIARALGERFAATGGALLAIDYGHDGGFGDTLQALRRHAFDDPLAHPGEADLTAHVDFAALAEAALQAGAHVEPLETQGDFLLRHGLLERAGRLGAGKDAATQEAIRAAVERLAAPQAMGQLFKVLTVTGGGRREAKG